MAPTGFLEAMRSNWADWNEKEIHLLLDLLLTQMLKQHKHTDFKSLVVTFMAQLFSQVECIHEWDDGI